MFEILDKTNRTQSMTTILTKRRQELLSLIEQHHSDKKGRVVLFAPVETGVNIFLQDSAFFYFSGMSEPAMTLTFGKEQHTVLYEPDFGGARSDWMQPVDVINQDTIALFGVQELKNSGKKVAGYTVGPYFNADDYVHIIEMLQIMVAQKEYIFTLYPQDPFAYASVKSVVDRLATFVPGLMNYVVDTSPLVAQMRRTKDISEIEKMYQAVSVTQAGFQAAARMIKPGAHEAELHAALEYIFTENNCRPAYSSIVAGGARSTILHYHANNQELQNEDLVLIDAGAMYQHYCADITRTFPVSGTFTDRQKEVYNIVLETQQHVVEHIRPGVWLSNVQEQGQSLQHVALSFLKKKGYDSYFKHGIGHFLGLDVHDVGDRSKPLAEGDVITIEPGIYLPEESIGVRIEDNYWVVADSEPVCLSESIPKTAEAVEEMVQESFDVDVM